MKEQIKGKAIIIGAGIGGLCAAIALKKAGFEPVVYENKPEVRFAGAGLGIGANAIRGLHHLGIGREIEAAGQTLDELRIVSSEGKIIQRSNSAMIKQKYGADNFTILRADLLTVLMRSLESAIIRTSKKCIRFEATENHVQVWFADGSSDEGDVLVAADGIHSVIRKELLPDAKPSYAGYTCWRAVIDDRPEFRFDRRVFTETWGTKGRFGIVPLANNKIYWFACKNAPANDSHSANAGPSTLLANFFRYHDPIPQMLEHTPDDRLIWNDIVYLKPIRRFAFGRVALLGDAAHATTPNMGQGAGQAIEDAIILAGSLKQTPDVAAALKQYEEERVTRTGKITRMSNRIGQMAQLEQPWLTALRNKALPLLPKSMAEKQLEFLYRVKLDRL
ncbi:FAD-dependent monooxygenase [Paenibacillus eucommiae]|uniref:2-polyprenyl-6-methoxyphenol hydroxylase-like FAD-dependent oxidoreductase n=1 Tax=Paenibacillus eucommiae TaxID=1355755 RepID=A0ABS4JAD6_9BACL|nr:FAD-dependent monooxygenase [Paenibacillus eucommiae]MBP1996797.1 2-polyprenyl-6-methoxyphenol hydroxylase-like FAD-dependent oxidoreductase [Paenibacillus eucommiae]